MNILGWTGPYADPCAIDDELLERSSLARAGCRVIRLAALIRAVEPLLILIVTGGLMIVALAQPALGQTPGGNIFGGNDQTLGNGVRQAIRYGRNLLFLLGIAGVGWGTFNLMTEKAWGRQMIGGLLCLGFGGVVSLVYSFSQGNAVNLDTDLGN
jgi:hypothetical protein